MSEHEAIELRVKHPITDIKTNDDTLLGSFIDCNGNEHRFDVEGFYLGFYEKGPYQEDGNYKTIILTQPISFDVSNPQYSLIIRDAKDRFFYFDSDGNYERGIDSYSQEIF